MNRSDAPGWKARELVRLGDVIEWAKTSMLSTDPLLANPGEVADGGASSGERCDRMAGHGGWPTEADQI